MPEPRTSTTSAALPSDAEAIDQFLAAQAPQWLKAATPAQLQTLRASLRVHVGQQLRIQQLLQRIQPLDDFTRPLLTQALRGMGLDLDTQHAIWREVRLAATPVLFPVFEVSPPTLTQVNEDSDLLQRALQNFTAGQGGSSNHFPGTGIHLDGLQAAVNPAQFADLCRALDLGGQYQRHLESILQPVSNGETPLALFAADSRDRLGIEAHLALLKGHVDAAVHGLLLQVCAGHADLRLDGYDVRLRGLVLDGCRVHDALVLDVQDPPFAQAARTRQLIVYLPDDPLRPLRQYASWAALGAALSLDLRGAEYRVAWLRRLGLDDRRKLAWKLTQVADLASAPLDADWVDFTGSPFTWLAEARIARVKADAASLAVPTAAVDQARYRARLQAYANTGMSLGGMLLAFLPGVGEVLLAATLVQMLGEVYEGVEDWHHSQRQAAMEHLLGVVENLGVMAVLSAGGMAVIKLLPRQAFVDQLQPVLRDDGGQRLWNNDLLPYRSNSAAAPLDIAADGLSHTGERHWLRQEGQVYEVQRHPQADYWRLRHPQRATAYAPRLEHNGEAAWLLPGEEPLQWQGLSQLLRRCWPWAQDLSEADCQHIGIIAGVDEAQLRGLLVEQRSLPVGLRDSVQQVGLDQRVSRFLAQLTPTVTVTELDPVLYQHALNLLDEPLETQPQALLSRLVARADELGSALFECLLEASEPLLDAAGQLLRRDFPGLPPRYAQQLVEQVSADQLRFISEHQRLPLDLAEQARMALRDARLTRALLGLKLRHGYYQDTARLALALLRRNPAWTSGLSLELREGSAFGRLIERQLALADTRSVRVLVREARRFDAYTADGYEIEESIPAPGGFFEAVFTCMTAAQRQALGNIASPAQLQALLLDQALSQREQCGPLFGLVRVKPLLKPWQQLADGRHGYPLSGRRSDNRRMLDNLVRSLFPSFSPQQVDSFLHDLRVSDGNVITGLLRFQHQRQSLDVALSVWTRQSSSTSTYIRQTFASALTRCWRRGGRPVLDSHGRTLGYGLHSRAYLSDLPAIPANVSFAHVASLNLSGANLTGNIDAFLRAFSQLRWMSLVRCQLSEIPAAIAQMPSLSRLHLGHNRIRLGAQGVQPLAALNRLEVLSLEYNPLGATLQLQGLAGLRELHLRSAQLESLPSGLESLEHLHLADLRHNAISELPATYFSAPRRLRAALILQHNPLSRGTLERLAQLEQQVAQARAQTLLGEGLRRWSSGLEEPQLSDRRLLWTQLQDEPGAGDFLRLLSEMTDSAEFVHAPDYLRFRVWRMLEAAHENSALRRDLFELAANPVTCADSVALNFSNLEVRLELYHALARASGEDPRPTLLLFARQLFRLEQVERIAQLDIASRLRAANPVDEIEVSLAYRIGLSRELSLPGQPTHMHFSRLANVSEAQLTAAAQAVRLAETPQALTPFIAARDFWRDYVRRTEAARFDTLEQRFWGRLDTLEEQRERLNEGQYLQQINQLASERQAALDALLVQLTRQALA